MRGAHRILIAEDHTILREGLRALLSQAPNFEIVGEVADGLDAVQSVETLRPDIVLMDLTMPRMHGLEAIREIVRRSPETKILVLTVHTNEEYVLAAFAAGAKGYLLKDASHAELLTAIRTILSDKPYLSPEISAMVLKGYLDGRKHLSTESTWDTLTQREREILKLVAEGYKNKDVADLLCISEKTAQKHRANLMKKLDIHNVAGLTAFAIDKGLVSKT